MLYSKIIQTPLGDMLAVANGDFLLMLDFVDGKYKEKHKNSFFETISECSCPLLEKTEKELILYFAEKLTEFSVPVKFSGTEFQQTVWQTLQKIPFGKTVSYGEQAQILNKPKSVRAVAAANGQNKISIIVPCHRVVGANGTLTGYAGGIKRKKFLLELENSTKLYKK